MRSPLELTFGALLGALGPLLGGSWPSLGRPWSLLGPSWGALDRSWGELDVAKNSKKKQKCISGASWLLLALSWPLLASFSDLPGCILVSFWPPRGPSALTLPGCTPQIPTHVPGKVAQTHFTRFRGCNFQKIHFTRFRGWNFLKSILLLFSMVLRHRFAGSCWELGTPTHGCNRWEPPWGAAVSAKRFQ